MLPGAPQPRLTRAFWARGARLVTAATALKLLPLVVFVVGGAAAVHGANFATPPALEARRAGARGRAARMGRVRKSADGGVLGCSRTLGHSAGRSRAHCDVMARTDREEAEVDLLASYRLPAMDN